jgi:hypothetical protein
MKKIERRIIREDRLALHSREERDLSAGVPLLKVATGGIDVTLHICVYL